MVEGLILKLAVVLLVGFIGAILARKIKLPNVSGFLLLGLLLGPSMGLIFKGYPGFITPAENQSLSFIGEIGLAFIAFSIGSEFALKSVKKMGKSVLVLTTTEVIGAVLVVFLALLFLPKPASLIVEYNPFNKNNIAFGLILASMSAATAPAATLMVIRQYRAYGPVTKTILPITALDDIFGIIVFGFFISIAQSLALGNVGNLPIWLVILKPFIEVFGSIILGVLLGTLLSFLANKYDKIRDDLQVIALLTVLFTIGITALINNSLAAYGISFSQLLSNITIGTMIANLTKKPEKTFAAINDFATPFYVMFFTLAGASLDLGILGTDSLIIWISLVYIIARGFGKWFGILVGAKIMKSPPTVKKYLGIALLPQGGVSLGLLVVVTATMPTIFSAPIRTIIMLSILVYETFGPLFAKIAISKAGEVNGLDRLDELSMVEDLISEGGE